MSLRTKKSEEIYRKHQEKKKGKGDNSCPLCDRKPIKKFKYWKVIQNKFPYDRIAKTHHMLIPIRHITEDKLDIKELNELKNIKRNFLTKAGYHYILEATYYIKSLPDHFHLHLITLKK